MNPNPKNPKKAFSQSWKMAWIHIDLDLFQKELCEQGVKDLRLFSMIILKMF